MRHNGVSNRDPILTVLGPSLKQLFMLGLSPSKVQIDINRNAVCVLATLLAGTEHQTETLHELMPGIDEILLNTFISGFNAGLSPQSCTAGEN